MAGAGQIKVVVFDVGETLINEERMWLGWAAYLDVTMDALLEALDTTIKQRRHHWEALRSLHPNLDVRAAQADRLAKGETLIFDETDLYPDAIPTVSALRHLGYEVGIVGNQPARSETALGESGLQPDFVESSASWGVEKPNPEFFRRVLEHTDCAANEVAYVGDRLDNDVLPALVAGMVVVFLERGPWGRVHATWYEVGDADIHIKNLGELSAALDGYGSF